MKLLIRFVKSPVFLYVVFLVSIILTLAVIRESGKAPTLGMYWIPVWWGLPLALMMVWTRHDHFNETANKFLRNGSSRWWNSLERSDVRQRYACLILVSGPVPLVWLHRLNRSLGSLHGVHGPAEIQQSRFSGKNTAERVRDMLRKIRHKQYVYLLHDSASGLYKIGFTKHPDQRILDIEHEFNVDLDYVCTIETDNMRRLEEELHKKYAKKRLEGEWFDLDEAEVEYITGLSKKTPQHNEAHSH